MTARADPASSSLPSPLLDISDLSISFGGLKAVQGLSIQVPPGALHGLIGPNGAGKTTCFNLLTGVYRPHTGSVKLAGRDITGLRPHQIAAAGLSRTFQNIRLFADLTVLDNVRTACHLRSRQTMAGAVLRSCFHCGEELAVKEKALGLLGIFGLAGRADDLARNLPYGDQRRLEIARALATDPQVLLLDEPAAGMNPQEKRSLRALIRSVRDDFGLAVLLIEHDMGVVMDICERITVLDYGKVIAVGTAREIQNDPKVIEAYLGEAPAEGRAA